MPKNEIDPEDPMELRGVALLTQEDTSETMTECFIEEFMRLGHDPGQILALFRNPHYTGVNLVLQNRGETFVKTKIAEVLGWWRRPVPWPDPAAPQAPRPHEPEGPGTGPNIER